MSETLFDAILGDLLEQVDAGREPSRDQILARYPEDPEVVERIWQAFATYRGVRDKLASTPPVIETLATGERLGDFEIVSLVGHGGMGSVYRARQLSLGGRMVALKVLPAGGCTERAKRRFEREALLLAELRHPHLAEVHGFGEERGMVFYAMRLVEGPSLREVLERLAQAPSEAAKPEVRRRIVQRIAETAAALEVVHRAGLVHRDVKPANVVLEAGGGPEDVVPDQRAVLVDFGLVRHIETHTLTLTGHSPATPSYAPPEQLLGQEVDARADVFSLGVTLHDLLSCRQPSERMQASAGLEPLGETVPGIDADLSAVVAKACDPEARWRYADAGDLLADLRAWLAGREVSARRPAPSERLARWARAHPGRFAARAAATLLLAALAVFGIAGYRSLDERASEARRAFAAGDVPALVEALAGVPRAAEWPFLRDGELVAVARRVRRADPDDPLLAIHRYEAARNVEEALFAAATHLRKEGLGSDPLVIRYIESSLRRTSDALGEDRLRLAIFLAARLLYERPVETSADVAATAGLRDALAELARRPELERDSRLYALTALSGCGTPEEADWIAEEFLGPEQPLEEQRMGMRSIERILRRAHACGLLDRIDFDHLWGTFHGRVDARFEYDNDAFLHSWLKALDGLHLAGILGLRARRDDLEHAPFSTGRWRLEAMQGLQQPEASQGVWMKHLAAAREPLLGTISEFERVSISSGRPGSLDVGWMAAVFADAVLTDELRRFCERDYADPTASGFEEGLRRGQDEARGIIREMDLDEDTLLGAEPPETCFSPLALSRREGDRRFFHRPSLVLDLRPPWDSPRRRLLLQPTLPEAFWLFRHGDPTAGGAAMGAEMRAAAIHDGGVEEGYIRLGIAGTSEVRLAFELGVLDARDHWQLVLRHQMGTRDYYPFEGRAELEIRLNGVLLGSGHLVAQAEGHDDPIELPKQFLEEGTNRIAIRLARTSTTTYRLLSAEVRRHRRL